MSNKHAYLIMAHNQQELLKKLLKALDYVDNDIYLHIDEKMKDIDEDELYNQIKLGKLYILSKRINVKWGHYSQIECELYLLEEATKEKHLYYHLMSGTDFPLKSQEEIHNFFAQANGKEYVQFETKEIDYKVKQRVSKYHFFIKRNESKTILDRVLNTLQIRFQFFVDRTKNSRIVFQKGANWFSITDSLARYVVEQKNFICQYFKYSLCGDEMFLQTVVYNSPYRSMVCEDNFCDNYSNIMYCIDWNRGKPYEFTEADYEMLVNSEMLFARKFNWEKDNQIVLKLLDHVCGGE